MQPLRLSLAQECADMMRNTLVTALGFVVLVVILSVLPVTTASTQPMPGAGPMESGGPAADPKAACEKKGTNYRWEAGSCIKMISKTKPPTSGGVGGGSDDCGAGYVLVPERGCVKLGDPSGHAYGGGGGGTPK